jgi:PAS domain S-box-containing protein
MASLYGVPADEVIGTTPAERFPDLATPAIRQAHASALAGETVTQRARRIEVGRARPDGTPDVRWVDVAYTPLRAHDGRVIGGVGLLHDVTEARRAAEEVERLSTVVRQTDDAVAITDAHARVQWVNAAWERMTGWSLSEVRGRNPGHFLHGPDTDHETRLGHARRRRRGRELGGRGPQLPARRHALLAGADDHAAARPGGRAHQLRRHRA